MDGSSGTVKNLVYRRVLSEDVVINTPREFAEFANQISRVYCLFLDKSEFIQEPKELPKATLLSSTLKVCNDSLVCPYSFSNHFLKLSEDLEPSHVEKYGAQCGHSVNNINDESLSSNCYKRYILGEEWLKCPVCCQWYHEDCFYVCIYKLIFRKFVRLIYLSW